MKWPSYLDARLPERVRVSVWLAVLAGTVLLAAWLRGVN